MKKTEELKQKVDELKKRISFLLDEFNSENGQCEIEIDLKYHYSVNGGGEKIFLGREIYVTVKI